MAAFEQENPAHDEERNDIKKTAGHLQELSLSHVSIFTRHDRPILADPGLNGNGSSFPFNRDCFLTRKIRDTIQSPRISRVC